MTEEPDEENTSRSDAPLLTGFSVDGLYGRYTYQIKVPPAASGKSRLILLHGDNGCGKTTLLRLLWHSLSPADNRRHRSTLAQIPFRALSIDITGDIRITIRKVDGLTGSFNLIVERPGVPDLASLFEINARGAVPPTQTGRSRAQLERELLARTREPLHLQDALTDERRREQVLEFLGDLDVAPVYLADDRRVYVDDPELDRLREVYIDRESQERPARDAPANDLVGHELRITIRRVNDWLRTLTLRGQNVGSAGANTIYRNVLQQLAATGQGPAEVEVEAGSEVATSRLLADLRVRSPRFEQYDLVPQFQAEEFQGLLERIASDRLQLAQEILVPYLESLSARFNALEEAEQLVTALLSATNEFLIGKQLVFSARARDGLRIVTDDDQVLDPLQLSSGERQLMMLVCTTLLAGRDSRLFLIDEPELSGPRRKFLGGYQAAASAAG